MTLVNGNRYIAVELAGVLNALGVETHLFIRGETFLRSFDPMIQETMTKAYEDAGVIIHKSFKGFQKIERLDQSSASLQQSDTNEKLCDGPSPDKQLRISDKEGQVYEFNELLWAIGRAPEIKDLNLDVTGVELSKTGHVAVDKFQNTYVSLHET
jgi:glutathione reductase (NADPH)